MKDFVVLILCTKFEVNIIIASGIMCNTVLQSFDLNLIVTFIMVGQLANVRGSMVPTSDSHKICPECVKRTNIKTSVQYGYDQKLLT